MIAANQTSTKRIDSIVVRPLSTLDECRAFQELQRRVWVGEDDADVVPVHVLITQAKNGGMLLGAFAEGGPEELGGLVGAAFGWPGFAKVDGVKQLKFCSHIVGVLPEWHGRGIGLRLKLAQRDHLLADGLMDWATWTYDPLQRVNAIFNIHRLGASCVTYLRNVYGEMTDRLNAGMPTDRCQVDWRLRSDRVRYALAPDRRDPDWSSLSLEVLPTRPLGEGSALRVPVERTPALDGRPLAVPIPTSVSALRAESQSLLIDWRLSVRHGLEAAFAAGYRMVDCVHLPDQGWHYILTPPDLRPFGALPWP